jgi:hypothetical protein
MPHQKAEYICADLSSRPQLFPCSRTADHTYSEKWPVASHVYDLSTTRPLKGAINE